MVKSYCVKQRKQTECIEPSGYKTAKNGRLMHFCTCAECFITKTKFVKSQKGGALARKKGPSVTDKIAYVGSMVVNPTASWGALGRVLASQAYKGVKDNYDYYKSGRGVDIQKHLSKLGELHMRTPTGKKYNYCGPGTKLEERLASNDPKVRDPINNLDSICQRHDIAYSRAKNLKDKHAADDIMLDEITQIPYMKRPWGTTAVQAMITGKRKLGLGAKKKTKKKPGKKN